jgi:anti-sigma factor RsiW
VNVEAYISSGILEAYALGELTEQERAEVEKNLAALSCATKRSLPLLKKRRKNFLMKAGVQPKSNC